MAAAEGAADLIGFGQFAFLPRKIRLCAGAVSAAAGFGVLKGGALGFVGESKGAGRTVADALFGSAPESLLDGGIERSGDADIKTAADESEAERFAGQLGQANANAAEDALPGLENDAARLRLLFEGPPLGAEPAGIGAVNLGVVLEHAVA